MFEAFPKTRKPLPSEYQAIYESFYKSNRNGESAASGAAQKMERWLHKKVAADTQGLNGRKTLEIGAGTLNQLDFECDFSHYDIIEPFKALYEGSLKLDKIHKIYNDISEVAHEYGVGNERERERVSPHIEFIYIKFKLALPLNFANLCKINSQLHLNSAPHTFLANKFTHLCSKEVSYAA